MAGSKEGGARAAKTNKERYGQDFYERIGSRGGKKKGIVKGFAAMTREQRIEAGRRGGKKSRRKK